MLIIVVESRDLQTWNFKSIIENLLMITIFVYDFEDHSSLNIHCHNVNHVVYFM